MTASLPEGVPDFPHIWDSTIRSAFANCPRKFYWEFVRNRRRPGGNIHFLFGGCLAKACEVTRKAFYEKGFSSQSSVIEGIIAASNMWVAGEGDELVPRKGPSVNKTYAALVDAIESYFVRWSLEDAAITPLKLPNGELFVEKTFAFPIEGTSHPITGVPIVYAGRLDMLGVWNETGLNIGVDEKHSTQLGDSWAKNWPMRSQITGYCRGGEVYNYHIRMFHIRGIGILKNDITFAEDIQNREQWQIDDWMIQIRRDINRASSIYKLMYEEQERNGFDLVGMHKHWDQNFDTICSSYGGCPAMDLCTSNNPERWIHNYDEVIWNPLERGTD